MNLIRSGLKVFIARTVMAIVNFLAIVLFSRELGATPLGTFYPFLALLGILSIPADFGIRSATEKRISEGQDPQTLLGTAIVLKIPSLLIISIIIFFSRTYINQFLGENLIIPLVIVLYVQEAARLSLFVLRGELRVGETAVAQVLRPLGWLIVGYFLYLRGFGVHGLVYGYITGSLAMMIVGWLRVSIIPSRPSIHHARSLINYGKFSVMSSVGGYFYSWMDVAILTVFVAAGITETRASIGAYENAWRVSLVVVILSRSLATTLFPQVSRWDVEDATDRIESVIPSAILPGILITIPAFVGTAVLSKDILRILFGPEFTLAWIVLIVLMGEKILQSIHIVFGRCLQAVNRPDLAAYATFVAVVINLLFNIILIWHYGIVGAAVATTISFAANTVLHAYYLNKFVDIELPIGETIWGMAAAGVMGSSVYWMRLIFEIYTIIHLLGLIILGFIVYTVCILAYKPIRIRTKKLISKVL